MTALTSLRHIRSRLLAGIVSPRDAAVEMEWVEEECERMEKELTEALSALSLRTGMCNWENAIKSRVARGITEVRCDACGGAGTEPRGRGWQDDDERTCQMCGGSGYVMQDLAPKTAKEKS